MTIGLLPGSGYVDSRPDLPDKQPNTTNTYALEKLWDQIPQPLRSAFTAFAIAVTVIYEIGKWAVVSIVFIGGLSALFIPIAMTIAPIPTILACAILIPTVVFFLIRTTVRAIRKFRIEMKNDLLKSDANNSLKKL